MRKRIAVFVLAALLGVGPQLAFAATLTVQKPTLTGVGITYAAASAGGDQFVNTGYEVLNVRATSTPVVVTVTAVAPCDQGVLHNISVTVPAASERAIGPFRDLRRWNNATTKRVSVTYDQVTGVTVAVVGR